MQSGERCYLYKTCKICGEKKHFTQFPKNGKRHRSRRSYCVECKERRHERYIPGVVYNLDVSLLSEEFIKVRKKNKNGKYRCEYLVPLKEAKQLVIEGAAAIVHETLIHRLYSREQFRQLILKKDRFTCFYCGSYGNTIDHVVPKSKGGLTTPKNCVCACIRCNQQKGNMNSARFLGFINSQ